MVVLAAVAMAADWIVANRFYRPRETADPELDAVASFANALEDEADEVAEEDPPISTRTGRPSVPPPLPEARA